MSGDETRVEAVDQAAQARAAHRRFGVQFNNEVWELLDAGLGPDSPAAERDRALYGAFAAARHWQECGTPANAARAEHLISRAALAVGSYPLAVEHARRCLDVVLEHPGDMADWDLAFAHEAMARGCAAVGDVAAGRRHLDLAREATAAVADADDRELLLEQLRTGPWFDLG